MAEPILSIRDLAVEFRHPVIECLEITPKSVQQSPEPLAQAVLRVFQPTG